MNFCEFSELKTFNIRNAETWGVERDEKYGGFKVPIIIGDHKEVCGDLITLA